MRRLAVLVLLAVALAASGCGGSSRPSGSPGSGTYVTAVPGSNAFVAVVVGKTNVAAYVCNGGQGIAQGFSGRRSGNRVQLSAAHGARLSATLAGGAATGTVTLAGARTLRFSARPAGGRAGLYHASGGRPVKASWVVLPDGRQRGTLAGSRVNPLVGTALVRGTGTVQVAKIDPGLVAETGIGDGFGTFGQ
jgi:hypothetical protein